MEAFYTSATEFYVAGDYSTSFTSGRRLKIDCGVDGVKYDSVVSSSYLDPSTAVTISGTITSNITEALLGIVQPGVTGSLPDHYHTTIDGDGGSFRVDIQTEIEANTTSIATNSAYLNSRIDTLSGTISLYGTRWVTAGDMSSTTTSGAQAGTNEYSPNDINIEHYAFDASNEEHCEFDLVMPDEWDLGTIKAKFYWSSATGSTTGDTLEWEIIAVKLTDSTDIGAISGPPQTITDALLADNGTGLQITPATSSITVGGAPVIGDMVHFKVSRTVSGTLSEDAWLLGVLIQYYKDSVGKAW